MLNDEQRRALDAQLPRDVIKQLPRKGSPDYVPAHYVISRLNEVFGYDGWHDTYDAPVVREGPRPAIYVSGRLAAAGVTRGDIGVGVAADESADAFETAMKAAHTDCLKRCARKLGDSFGLALYEKVERGQRRSGVGISTMAQSMLDEVDALSTADEVNAWARANAAHVGQLDDDEQSIVKGAVASRRRDLAPEQPAPMPSSTSATPVATEHAARPQLPPVAANDAAASDGMRSATIRLGVARSPETIVAVLRGASVRDDERAALWSAAVGAAARLSVDEPSLRARVENAKALNATVAQWGVAALVLAAVDTANTVEALAQVRKQYAERVMGLPEALAGGVKRATTARATALGAPTVATKLLADANAATRESDLRAVHERLQREVAAKSVSQSDVDRIVAALNARAEALTGAAA